MRVFRRTRLAGLPLALALAAFVPACRDVVAQAAAVNDLVFEIGPTTYRIKRLEAQGMTLSELELARLFDPKDTAPAKDRFARLNAARIIIPEISGESEAFGLKQRFIYRGLVLENLKAGQIGSLRAASFEQIIERPKGGQIEAHYGQINIKNLDLAQIAHIYGDARAVENETAKPVQGEAVIDSAEYAVPDSKLALHIGRISMRGFKARTFARPLSLWFAEASDGVANEDQSAALALAVLDAIDGSEVGLIEARDIVATGVAAGAGGKPFSMKLGRVALSNLVNSVAGNILIEDLSLAGAQSGNVIARHLTMRGLELRPLSEPGGRRFPRVAHLEISGLDADLPDQENGGLTREKFRLAAAVGDFAAYRDGIPTKLLLKADKLSADLSARAETPFSARLSALGYKELDVSGILEGEWRESEQDLTIHQATLDARDMGRLRLSGTMTNVPALVFSPNTILARAAALPVLIQRLEASFENRGLVEKTFELEAKSRRTDPASLRADFASTAETAVSTFFEGSEKGRLIGEAIAKFIATPKRLHLRFESATGIGAFDAMKSKPGEILQRLDVDALANQ
jgi:hypothetical protein